MAWKSSVGALLTPAVAVVAVLIYQNCANSAFWSGLNSHDDTDRQAAGLQGFIDTLQIFGALLGGALVGFIWAINLLKERRRHGNKLFGSAHIAAGVNLLLVFLGSWVFLKGGLAGF